MTKDASSIAMAASTLDALPDKSQSPSGVMATVQALYEKISAALDKGYTYDEIAKLINESGIEIKTTTLRQYYNKHKTELEKRKAELSELETAKKSTKLKKEKSPKSKADDNIKSTGNNNPVVNIE